MRKKLSVTAEIDKRINSDKLYQRCCLTLPVPTPGPHLASDEEGGGGGVTSRKKTWAGPILSLIHI